MEEKKEKKLSYDELMNYANQLSIQNQNLNRRISEQNYSNAFTRLEFLFRVLDKASMFNRAFVDRCVAEIEATITLPEPQEEQKEE